MGCPTDFALATVTLTLALTLTLTLTKFSVVDVGHRRHDVLYLMSFFLILDILDVDIAKVFMTCCTGGYVVTVDI